MITNIQDVSIPTKGIGKKFAIKVVAYEIGGTSAIFYWYVLSDENIILLDGNISITEPEINSWGTDDNYIIDWALNNLGFIKQ